MPSWSQGYIALGSSLGDRIRYLKMGILHLDIHPQVNVLQCSQIWATQPIGAAQNQFLNMVLRIETSLEPLEMLDLLLEIELKNGRKRGVHWMDRTLDLDLLLLDTWTWHDSRLQLPHPRMFERAFVLVPLKEIFCGERGELFNAVTEPPKGMWPVGLFSLAKNHQIKYFAKKQLYWSSL